MSTWSWFEPDRFIKHASEYADLRDIEVETLLTRLEARWEAESGTERRQAAHTELETLLAGHLESLDAWPEGHTTDAGVLADQMLRVTWLEQLTLALVLHREDLGGLVEIEGLETVRALIADHGGVQFALAHHGPHFIVHMLLARFGLAAMAGGAHSAEFAAGAQEWARAAGFDVSNSDGVDFGDDFRAEMAALLAAGHSVTLYPEYSRSRRLGRLTVPFLGQTVHAPTGVVRLAQAFARPLVTVALHRTAPFRYVLRFQSLGIIDSGEDAVEQTAVEVFSWLEGLVREDPGSWDGWRWFHVMKSNGFQVLLRNLAREREQAVAK